MLWIGIFPCGEGACSRSAAQQSQPDELGFPVAPQCLVLGLLRTPAGASSLTTNCSLATGGAYASLVWLKAPMQSLRDRPKN
ncbi:hypothetical protein EMIT0P260_10267 [Pseudomonas sp. IT-P260]